MRGWEGRDVDWGPGITHGRIGVQQRSAGKLTLTIKSLICHRDELISRNIACITTVGSPSKHKAPRKSLGFNLLIN